MTENNVTDLLKQIQHLKIDVWITGGWGIDALLGRQTRPHNDIDIFIQRKDANAFSEILNRNGYREIQMEYTTDDHTVWQNSENNTIDLHLFEFVDADSLRFENDIYPFELFRGKGAIGGMEVRCLTAEAQLLYHQGYEQTEKDRHDVFLLCEAFGLSVPKEYEEQ